MSLVIGDHDGDSDSVASVKTVDKISTRTVKRNTDGLAHASKASTTKSRGGGGLGP